MQERAVGELQEQVVFINRVAKVVKGGRRFSFSALVVVGDGNGKVGTGLGKANEVSEAIQKATEQAKKSMVNVSLYQGRTIPHEVKGHYGASLVILRPASPGTGVIAGGGARSLIEVAGIQDILTKCIGTSTPHVVLRATMNALLKLKDPSEIARKRGKTVEQLGRN